MSGARDRRKGDRLAEPEEKRWRGRAGNPSRDKGTRGSGEDELAVERQIAAEGSCTNA
jgi:hypothetical protein